MDIYREKELEWVPHPATGAERKILISKEKDKLDVTCMLVRIPKGVKIPDHTHDEQDDIIFVLQGKFKFWAKGIEYDAERGTLLRVPRGVGHRIYDVEEDVLLYDVFSPALL